MGILLGLACKARDSRAHEARHTASLLSMRGKYRFVRQTFGSELGSMYRKLSPLWSDGDILNEETAES